MQGMRCAAAVASLAASKIESELGLYVTSQCQWMLGLYITIQCQWVLGLYTKISEGTNRTSQASESMYRRPQRAWLA